MNGGRNQTLLIVEDDDNDFLFLERALTMENVGAQIHRACDGSEAIDYLSGEDNFANRDARPLPNLIVLDLKMPGTSGFEVLEWVREQPDFQTLPIIVFSSSEEPADVEKAYNLGANAYLVKPTSYLAYSDVVGTLKQYLSNGCNEFSTERKVMVYDKRLQ